jgi:serine/threonine protein kinase
MTPSEEPSPYPSPGDVIDGKYRCERLLGVGGMGAVALATHLLRKAPVALKFMNPAVMAEPSATERFINEAIAASRIDSEHVVKIFDVSQLPSGAPYLVMEYLEGQDLAQILSHEGKPWIESLPRAVHFVVQILRGLQVAHHAGIVHRDMKPSNCFVVNRDGEPDFVKLLDFGISKVEQPGGVSLTRTNSLLGTPLYMAPEQARSAKYADARTDLYAAGVILYELLTGSTPYNTETGEFADLLLSIFTAEARPLSQVRPELPGDFCKLVHKSFAREPADRFQSASEMIEALAPWADERSHAVIEAARRRAARAGSSPALSSVAPPPLPALSKVEPKVAAASVRPPPPSEVLPPPAPPDSLATNVARPASPTVVRKRTGAVLLLAAGFLIVGLVAGLLVFDHLRSTPDPQGLVAASADGSVVPPVATVPSPPSSGQPAASSPAIVVLAPPTSSPSAPATTGLATARPPATAPATAAPPRPDAGRPRIGDISIQQ